jgi:hypothetical protein
MDDVRAADALREIVAATGAEIERINFVRLRQLSGVDPLRFALVMRRRIKDDLNDAHDSG